jgi:AcrR family transcriptional regulator
LLIHPARACGRAPTLYHHFGSKQALMDAVVSHSFEEFLRDRRGAGDTTDPIDVRERWDNHIAFGLALDHANVLTHGERALMHELLARLADAK